MIFKKTLFEFICPGIQKYDILALIIIAYIKEMKSSVGFKYFYVENNFHMVELGMISPS